MRRRRELLLAGALTAVGAAVPAARAPAAAPAPGPAGDPGLLASALRLERLVLAAYGVLLAAPGLAAGERRTLGLIHDQELAHAEALARLLGEIGGRIPPAERFPAALEAIAPGLGTVRDARGALRYALVLEDLLVFGYRASLPGLSDDKIVQTAAGVMCDEAAHQVLLREALGEDPVPRALEGGALPLR